MSRFITDMRIVLHKLPVVLRLGVSFFYIVLKV